MKKIFSVFFAILLLVGCGDKGEKYEYRPVQSSAVEYTDGDITLEVSGDGITGDAERIIAVVTNNGDGKIFYDGLCSFNVLVDGQWCYRVSTSKKNESNTSLLYSIEPGKSEKKIVEVDLLPAGTYRIRAYFWLDDMKTINDKPYYLEYEFNIE